MSGSTRDLTANGFSRMIMKNGKEFEAVMKKYTAPEMDIESLTNDIVTASGVTPEPTPCTLKSYNPGFYFD